MKIDKSDWDLIKLALRILKKREPFLAKDCNSLLMRIQKYLTSD